jgi:hypothetical protein
MGHELKDREIFATGIWNQMAFDEADLDDIVANFEKLKDTHKVPLKFGHNKEQKITDGQPAIGWVSRIFKIGNKLFADFSDLPRTVYEAIKNKLYRTVSIELLFNVNSDGKKFNHVLDAVALLGADHPAVSSLADLDALLAKRTVFNGGHRVAFETIADGQVKFTSEVEMDKKEVQELIDATTKPLQQANEALTKKLDASEAKNAQFVREKAESEEKARKELVTLARKNVTDVLDAAVKAKSLTPAMRETYAKQIGVDDDARVASIKLEEVKAMFNVKAQAGQQGLHQESDTTENPEEELLNLVRKNQASTGKPFAETFMLTCAANPKLHKAYLDMNGEK